MPSTVEECLKPSWKCQGISHCLESGRPVCHLLNVLTLLCQCAV